LSGSRSEALVAAAPDVGELDPLRPVAALAYRKTGRSYVRASRSPKTANISHPWSCRERADGMTSRRDARAPLYRVHVVVDGRDETVERP
jgi:hypothetical protein